MAISREKIADTIEEFVREEFPAADEDPMFSRDANLFEGGFLDSLGFVHLLALVQSTFGVTVEADSFMSDGLKTINGISRFIGSALARDGPLAAEFKGVTDGESGNKP